MTQPDVELRDLLVVINQMLPHIQDENLKNELVAYANSFRNKAPEILNDYDDYWTHLLELLVKYIGNLYPEDGWKETVVDIFVGGYF